MHFRITGDISSDSGVGKIITDLSGPTRLFFKQKEYGTGINGIVIVLMCQDSSLNLKRRLRFSKKENFLYMDIMLDLDEMKAATPEKRKQNIIQRVIKEVHENLSKYSIKNFDIEKCVADLKEYLNN
jgi:hypothetical protein